MAKTLKLCIFDPMYSQNAFGRSKFILIFWLLVYNFRKKKTHFGFTNLKSKMHVFRIRTTWSSKFWLGSPCIFLPNFITDTPLTFFSGFFPLMKKKQCLWMPKMPVIQNDYHQKKVIPTKKIPINTNNFIINA